MQRIFDKKVDCYCNKDNNTCTGNCKCYCHIPIWYRKLVWKIQDIKGIGNVLIVLLMMIFQPFITIYLIFYCNKEDTQLR